MYRRILLTLDGSDIAEKALPHAKEIARCFGATLVLTGVVEAEPIQEGDLTYEIVRKYLDSLAERLHLEGLAAESLVAEGAPADAIMLSASEESADLIVMSSHGRSANGLTAFGPVAERILRDSPIPVLLVRS